MINSKLLRLKKEEKNEYSNTNLITINGVKRSKGLTTIKIRIFDIEKKIDVYIVDGKDFKYDFLIGLDIIKEFNLIQNENLEIQQKSKINFTNEELYQKNNPNENENKKKLNFINFNEHVKEENL